LRTSAGMATCTENAQAGFHRRGEKQRSAEGEACCRICFESEETGENPLISPCKCTGSMRWVHRACLDQWRISSVNPKALMGCTTCHTPFRTEYRGPDKNAPDDLRTRRWWRRFAKEVAWYVGVRLGVFLSSVFALGFWPNLLGMPLALHHNPALDHLLIGTSTSLGLFGTSLVTWLVWHAGFQGIRFIGSLCRGTGSSGNGAKFLVYFMIVVGAVICLYYLLEGVWRLWQEGKREAVRVLGEANRKLRSQTVEDFLVLDYDGEV